MVGWTRPSLTPSIRIALNDLKLDRLVMVYPGDRRYVLADVMRAHVRHKHPDRAVAAADRLAELATPGAVYDSACGYSLCIRLADKLVPGVGGFEVDAALLLLAYAAMSADAEPPRRCRRCAHGGRVADR